MVLIRSKKTLTYTLAVDTSLVQGAAVVAATADSTHEVLANLSAATVVVPATQRLAHSCDGVTLLMAQTVG